MMQVFGRSSMSEFLGDRVVYRNLVPVDRRLPALAALREQVGLAEGRVPRKSEADYAQVIVAMLQQARQLDLPRGQIRRLLFVGDTRLNDGTAFANICRAGGWPGWGFIGAETAAPAAHEIVPVPGDNQLYLANRWQMVPEFAAHLARQGFVVDGETAVILDLDKTTLGARGRNDHVINQVRVEAVQETVAGLLGDHFDKAAFRNHYDELNQVDYHPFTTDNQDYLAYICLILGTDVVNLATLIADVTAGRLTHFPHFIRQVEERKGQLPPALAGIHNEIYANVQAGDPTPFKAFRRQEYRGTIARMGQLPDDAPAADLLAAEIVLTQEVRQQALAWQAQGALLFGLSDKPDEASIPDPALAAAGYKPIHRAFTHVMGA